MPSPQTLTEADRRTVATWAADCAEHVLDIFEVAVPGDSRPRDLIARARAFARGELDVAEGIRRRFVGGVPIAEMPDPAAAAAARSAGQAAAVVHMGAHALGAAAYAARAAELAAPDRPDAPSEEIHWQIDPYVRGGEISSSVTAAGRRECVRSARTGPPEFGFSRQDRRRTPSAFGGFRQ